MIMSPYWHIPKEIWKYFSTFNSANNKDDDVIFIKMIKNNQEDFEQDDEQDDEQDEEDDEQDEVEDAKKMKLKN